MAATAERLARYEEEVAAQAAADFGQDRDDARRRLIAVALGAGIVILLLLVTAQDVARLALEGERKGREGPSDEDRQRLMTQDVLLTLSLLLGAAALVLQTLPAGWLAGRLGLLEEQAPVAPEPSPEPSI